MMFIETFKKNAGLVLQMWIRGMLTISVRKRKIISATEQIKNEF